MARKRREEEPENHDRWLVSYADFITLLFAFFVVMYAISSVNEGKYKVLSNSLTNGFKNVTGQPGGPPIAVIQGAPLLPVKPIVKPDRLADLKKTEQRQKRHHGGFAAIGCSGEGATAGNQSWRYH